MNNLLLFLAATTPLLSTVLSTYHHPSPKTICKDYKIPLKVTSENYIFTLPKFNNNYDLADFVTDFAPRTAERDFHPFPPDTKTVLLATHGLNFNRG
jgi:hypothetical protein